MNDKSHAATPITATISELELELSAGVPSSLAAAQAVTASLHADSRPETVEQHLKRLYPDHYTRILTNSTRDGGPEHTASVLGYYAKGLYAHPLDVLFLWHNTPEGYEFWKALAQREGS